MADYCKQCHGFAKTGGDSCGFDHPMDFEDAAIPEGYVRANLCEGCGFTSTNAAGECVALDCMVDHTTGEYRTPTHG